MANAIKKISVARGYDVTRYTLQCFGGAGGQHACLVADALGMTKVFVHPWPVCCPPTAWAWPTKRDSRTSGGASSWAHCPPSPQKLDALAKTAHGELRPASDRRGQVHRRVHVRYEGSDSALVVSYRQPGGNQGRHSKRLTASALPS
jgi:5-oxoprolinase (ATP-hydrolysing)